MTADTLPTDEVDFDTALSDPAAYYAHPADIVGDDQLTASQKHRFLTEWAQDLADRQQAAEEGMDSVNSATTAADSELVRKVNACLQQVGTPADEGKPGRSFWRRLMPF